ncbi:tripartite tricarboxylate transporter substrate binding protein [Bordetella sp. BOR01]|uniref:Bug family tripartite tricarboxylate transporter substrate binding protein n=1 Tax=Bordetella sp. BOR01 TaxID=2854779 RepID=UPI001C4654D7|nr:tripartite tricarboxylate transporter substrate binding protein [Bordetella sp. BOR01]MBV7486843.1 tripartite tricarboxylate transporter substrate binding protein [Bordetella sp. BOR01]
MNRRHVLRFVGAGALAVPAWRVLAQGGSSYPDKPLRLVVPFPAGGAADNLARPLAEQLSAKLGQPVIVENRPGANTMIGAENVARAPADGYSLLLANEAGLSLAPAIAPITKVTMPYDAGRDFTPISVLGQYGSVLSVAPSLPVKTLREFIAYAKANPGKVNYASFGVGSQPHMMMEILSRQAGIQTTHIPYKGVAPALVDLVAGHVQAMISAPSAPLPYIKDGRLRALAYSGDARSPDLPDVPTFAEADMPDFDARGWFGVVMKAGTSDAIQAQLRRDIWDIVQSPEYRSRAIEPSGYEVPSVDPSAFPRFLTDDMALWKARVNALQDRLT